MKKRRVEGRRRTQRLRLPDGQMRKMYRTDSVRFFPLRAISISTIVLKANRSDEARGGRSVPCTNREVVSAKLKQAPLPNYFASGEPWSPGKVAHSGQTQSAKVPFCSLLLPYYCYYTLSGCLCSALRRAQISIIFSRLALLLLPRILTTRTSKDLLSYIVAETHGKLQTPSSFVNFIL